MINQSIQYRSQSLSQLQIMSKEKINEWFYIKVNSLTQFITFKMLTNFQDYYQNIQVYKGDSVQTLFQSDLLVIFQYQQHIHQDIRKSLSQVIQVKEMKSEYHPDNFETFNQFTSKVFYSKMGVCLLIQHFEVPNQLQIDKHLFSEEEPFRVEKIPHASDQYKCNWFLIHSTPSRAIPQESAQLSCTNLVKLNQKLIINVRKYVAKYWKYNQKARQKQIRIAKQNLIQILESNAIQTRNISYWIKLGYKVTCYLQIQFENKQLFIQILRKIYECGHENYLQLVLEPGKFIKFKYNSLYQIRVQLKKRIQIWMELMNITKWNAVPLIDRLNQVTQNRIQSQAIKYFQNPEILFVRNLYMKIQDSKSKDVFYLKDDWPDISDQLINIIRHWDICGYVVSTKTPIKLVLKILDYKFNKFSIPLLERVNMKDRNIEEKEMVEYFSKEYFYIFQFLYPQIQYIINSLAKLLNQKTIKQRAKQKYFQSLKRMQKFQPSKKKQKQSKASELPNQGKLPKQAVYERNLQEYQKQLKKIMESIQNQKQLKQKIKQNILDRLMMEYFEEIDSLNKEKGYFFMKVQGFQKKKLSQFIAELIDYQCKVYEWQDVYNLITINLRRIDQKDLAAKDNAYFQLYTNTKCLGCSQFFILNKSIIGRPNSFALRIFTETSVHLIREQLMKDIQFMLNNHGGIILFNCLLNYGSIVPKGAYLTNIDKLNFIQEIKNIINYFYPVVTLNQNIFVSFIPILTHDDKNQYAKPQAYSQRQKSDQYYLNLPKIKQFYVVRIKVVSKDLSTLYFLTSVDKNLQKDQIKDEIKDEVFYLNEFILGKRGIRYCHMHKAIKIKMKQYVADKDKGQDEFRPQTYGNPLNHNCKEPLPQIIETYEKPISQASKTEKAYSFMSMIVVKQQNIQKIKEVLARQGFYVHIQKVFQHYYFGIIKYTAVLHHNEPYADILKVFLSSKDLIFDGKRVLIILITEYLRIDSDEQFKDIDIENACLWLKKQFPSERLRYYKLPNIQSELINFYIRTQSKLSSLFMYYVFNQYKIKIIFKNPSSKERQRLVEIKLKERKSSINTEDWESKNMMI